jgi:hypothetical protein
MKLDFDPLPALRARVKDQINQNYNTVGANNSHLDLAYARKKKVAAEIKAGSEAPDDIVQEAQLRNVSVEVLVESILSKPDTIGLREIDRQRRLAKVEVAGIEELQQMVGSNG